MNKDFKLWFTDDYWDLYIWIDKKKKISSFQLGFGKPSDEQMVIWKKGAKSLKTAAVESGEDHPGINQSPILKEGIRIDTDKIIERFKKDSKRIDPAVSKFIIEHLK